MIAYYAHNHGYGHSNSAQEFCEFFKNRALVMTSSEFKFHTACAVVKINSEDINYSAYCISNYNLPAYAHYLPKSDKKLVQRNFQILETCLKRDIKFALIDVSVETAIQLRIAGIPYAYHRMSGNREDMPHQMAYAASEFLFAFFPPQMENSLDTERVKKTHYLGFISRFSFRINTTSNSTIETKNPSILILRGNGGTLLNANTIASICSQNNNYNFTVVGAADSTSLSNVLFLEFTHAIESLLLKNDIVIASCGLNLTAEILSVKNKFIAIPEEMPYKEQEIILEGLTRNHLAVELDIQNLEKSITDYYNLPINPDLESFFDTMSDFEKIPELKPFI